MTSSANKIFGVQSMSEVNSPAHYNQGGIECVDAIQAELTPDEFRGFLKGNITKHLWRERHKGGAVSIAKAKWYLDRLIGLIPDSPPASIAQAQPLDPNRVPTDEDAKSRPWVMGWDRDKHADNPQGPEQLVCVRGDDEYPFVTTRTSWRHCRFATDAEIAGLADAS